MTESLSPSVESLPTSFGFGITWSLLPVPPCWLVLEVPFTKGSVPLTGAHPPTPAGGLGGRPREVGKSPQTASWLGGVHSQGRVLG